MYVVTVTGDKTGSTWERMFVTLRRAEMHVRICRSSFHSLTVSEPVKRA